jgi:hypothetical protein
MPLKAVIISNGIEGLEQLYRSNEEIQYDIIEVEEQFNPNLDPYDILIAPNGTDHIALFRIKEKIHQFLAQGKTLFCFDGWFTNWVPGNRWVMDNTKKTIDVRYKIQEDPFGLSKHFSVEDLTFSHGISGWWSCGYIEPAEKASVLIEDTWGRALVVIDDATTNGTMILSASGPLADVSYGTTDDNKAYQAMTDLYKAILQFVQTSKIETA